MRGRNGKGLCLALAGGAFLIPQAASAVSSFDVYASGSVSIGESILDIREILDDPTYGPASPEESGVDWSDTTAYDGWGDAQATEEEVGALNGSVLLPSAGQISAEYNLTGSGGSGASFTGTSEAEAIGDGMPVNLPVSSDFVGVQLGFFEMSLSGEADGDATTFVSGLQRSLFDAFFTNESTDEFLVVDLLFSLTTTVETLVDDAGLEYATGESSFEILMGSDCSDGSVEGLCENKGGIGEAQDSDGFFFSNTDVYPFEVIVAPGETQHVRLNAFVGGQATSELTSEVPLPTALPLLGGALAGLGLMARRRARS